MKIGIVAEGAGDIAVIRNILKGALGLARKDVLPIRPELSEDETDLAESERSGGYQNQPPEAFSNWRLVLMECANRVRIAEFLEAPTAEERLVVVHIDTAEAHEKGYDVSRPPDRKAKTYVQELRERVVARIDGLLGAKLAARVRHAVAVEETEAWLLTIHDSDDRVSVTPLDPKKRLKYIMEEKSRRGLSESGGRGRREREGRARGGRDERGGRGERRKTEHELFDELSQDFRDAAKLNARADRNASLRLFVDSLSGPRG